jgi:hypothetical protein
MTLPLTFFERLSVLYRAHMMDPWWLWYDQEPSPRRALSVFMGQYAYERQGRAPAYPHAAYFAIMDNNEPALDPVKIWDAFQHELDGAKSNPKLNPLYHVPGSCRCASCSLMDDDGELINIVEVTRLQLTDEHVRAAFDHLNKIRGVGPKIASFFLRDVAMHFEIQPVRDRELLQPIDVWVRRYVARLTGTLPRTDTQTALWICRNTRAPEAVNQGLWYFGSQIATSDVKLRRALADDDYAMQLVNLYIDRIERAVTAWHGQGNPP